MVHYVKNFQYTCKKKCLGPHKYRSVSVCVCACVRAHACFCDSQPACVCVCVCVCVEMLQTFVTHLFSFLGKKKKNQTYLTGIKQEALDTNHPTHT